MKHNYFRILLLLFLTSSSTEYTYAGIFSRKTDSIKIVFDKNQLVLPGESFKIGVTSYHKKGKTRKTLGMNGGSVLWWRYKTKIIGGESTGGKIKVSSKLYPSKGKYISVKVWPRKHEELAQTMLIPLNYETQISFEPTNAFNKAPGCSFKGEIVALFNNDVIRTYSPYSSNAKRNYKLLSNGVHRAKNRFVIEPDFRNIIDHQVDIYIHSKRNPELTASYSIHLDYVNNYNITLRGLSGSSGFSGSDGYSGTFGGNGSQGQQGSNGHPGEDGPPVGVWTDNYFDSTLNTNLLYVYAENFRTGREYYYLINPNGGNLTIRSEGGDGGRGGDGGDGGNGGKGADGKIWYETVIKTRIVKKPFTETITKKVTKRRTTGTGEEEEYEDTVTEHITVYKEVEETYEERIKHQEPGEDGGNGGDGGAGGLGGPGGWGGDIYLYFTADAGRYEENIKAFTSGGNGGLNGDGGRAGCGGRGGTGSPDGKSGSNGWDGPEAMGWAPDGFSGQVFIESTEEFFFYEETAQNNPVSKK